jgi:hypothetical protein
MISTFSALRFCAAAVKLKLPVMDGVAVDDEYLVVSDRDLVVDQRRNPMVDEVGRPAVTRLLVDPIEDHAHVDRPLLGLAERFDDPHVRESVGLPQHLGLSRADLARYQRGAILAGYEARHELGRDRWRREQEAKPRG